MDIHEKIAAGGFDCSCGKYHKASLEKLIVRSGAYQYALL